MPAWLVQIIISIIVKLLINALSVNPYIIPASVKGRLMQLLDGPPVGEDKRITGQEPGSEP